MRFVSVIVLALFATAVILAQSGMRPGQWELSTQMQMPNMPNMPAGFQMPVQKTTQCITAEQAKDPVNTVPRQTGRGRSGPDDCKMSDYKTTGSTVTFSISCPSGKVTGTGEMTFGDDSYTNTLKMNTAQGEMTMKTTGKRIGDCTK
jgi:hypothetical protein